MMAARMENILESTLEATTKSMDTIGMISGETVQQLMATLELQYFKAVSLYRRRNYEKCVEVCNAMLQAGQENNVQMFTAPPDDTETHDVDDHHVHVHDNDRNVDKYVGGATNMVNSRYNNIKSNSVSYRSNMGNMGSNSISRYGSNLQRIAPRHNVGPWQKFDNHNTTGGGGGGDDHDIFVETTTTTDNDGTTSSHYYNNNYNKNKKINNSNRNTISQRKTVMPTWMMEGVWQLKMRALTQRVYIDDLETNDIANEDYEEAELKRVATAARPGTSIEAAFVPRPRTSILRTTASGRGNNNNNIPTNDSKASRSAATANVRPMTGVARPGTCVSRPGTSLGARPATRCGTASSVRARWAAALTLDDITSSLYQASKHNPTIYAERSQLVKTLFQYLYYHESDVPKAHALCQAVMDFQHQKHSITQRKLQFVGNTDKWWWQQQMGRCLLALRQVRQAEIHLQESLNAHAHPDTYLLLSRLYQRLDAPQRALALIDQAVDKFPQEIYFRLEQGQLFNMLSKPDDALAIYELISKLNPINIEALAGLAHNHFYDNNPEMALLYYRRIMTLGVQTAEIYCNIGLACLYGGQIDLVWPCFERAFNLAKTSDQIADILYNLSFMAVTTGDFVLARRCLQLCLVNDAHNAAALNNLAVLSARSGDFVKAKSYLTAARHLIYDAPEIQQNWDFLEQHYKL